MPELIIKLGDTVVQRYPIEKEVVSIGRAKDNDIVVENLSVSRNHARIRLENGRYSLVDLNSANGSFVNGTKITQAELNNDDIISIGKHKLHFVLGAAEGGTGVATQADAHAPVPGAFPAAQVPALTAPGGGPLHGFLLVTRGKQQNVLFHISGPTVNIGRASDNDIRLHDWFVSKKHATILHEGDSYLLRDLGSWRGLTVNSVPTKEASLKPNDEIMFGTTMVKFLLGPADLTIPGATRSTDLLNDVPLPDMPEGRVAPVEEESMDPFSTQELARRLTAADLEAPPTRIGSPDSSMPAILPSSSDDASPASADDLDDEFEPLSQEELEELERETDEALESMTHDENREAEAAEWEQIESDRLAAQGGGWERKPGAMLPSPEEEQAEVDVTHDPPDPGTFVMDKSMRGGKGIAEDEREEEDALFKGPVVDPDTIPAVAASQPSSTAMPIFRSAPAEPAADALEPPPGVDAGEFRKWARGMKNKSKIVRREAARKLKELTGNDYDWESEPR